MAAVLLSLFFGFFVLVRSNDQPVPYITFRGEHYTNYECINFLNIGEKVNEVRCHTDLPTCCTESQGGDRGDWYYPDGSRLPNYLPGTYIYQKRGNRRIDLRRKSNTIPDSDTEGLYKCAIETEAANPTDDSDVSGRATIHIQLKIGGCPITVDPIIALSENSRFSGEGPWFQLTCISTGSSKVNWTSEYYVSLPNTVTTVDPNNLEFIHTLTVTEKVGGLYTCSAPIGSPPSNSASFCIEVACEPTGLETEQVGLTEVKLTWTPPYPLEDTKGYKISYYYKTKTQESSNTEENTVTEESIEEYTLDNESTDNFLMNNLQNGVEYTVTITGISNHFSSEPVVTHVYVAPVGTPENFRAKAAQREVEFSWSRPKVTAPISSYTLSCDPSPGTLPLTVTEAGTHRIKEFYPDYFYWCSVVANYGSSVSGPPATTDVCTEEDHSSFNATVAGYINCSEWLQYDYDNKLKEIHDVIVAKMAGYCKRTITHSNIDQEHLTCLDGSTNSFNYTARLTSTFVDKNSTEIVEFLRQWVSNETTICVEGVLLRVVEDMCYENVSDVSSDVCQRQYYDTLSLIRKIAAMNKMPIILVSILTGIHILFCAICCLRRKTTKGLDEKEVEDVQRIQKGDRPMPEGGEQLEQQKQVVDDDDEVAMFKRQDSGDSLKG